MPRLDVRFKINLPAILHDKESIERRVYFREISLSGGVLTGYEHSPGAHISFSLILPSLVKIKFIGEIVRNYSHSLIVKFLSPDRLALAVLWDYLREMSKDLMQQNLCPYCGEGLSANFEFCSTCGQTLMFMADNYLDKHLLTSFTKRLWARLNKQDANYIERLVAVMDFESLEQKQDLSEEEFVGTTPAILNVFSMIRRAASTDLNVLVLGESGTGKELTARAIHEKSLRKDKPFIVVNCAAIPETLLEAELFGFEKGAFTGAYQTKKGRFELANYGSIFLDEIGDLSPALQAKLLRFLEDHIVERIGSKSGTKVDIRIIAATNCDLEAMVARSRFRKDLFFRLNSFSIILPPLRDRGDDKVILARYFFEKFNKDKQAPIFGLSEASLKAVREYHWPGNVRELINKVRRGLVMANGVFIEPADMELAKGPISPGLSDTVSKYDREGVIGVLEQNRFVVAHAAKAMQVSRPTMYSLIRKLGILLPNRQPPFDVKHIYKTD